MRRGTLKPVACLALAATAAVATAGCGSGSSETASTSTRKASGNATSNSSKPDACPAASYASDMAMIIENRIPGATLIVSTSPVNCAGWSGRGNYTLLRGPLDNRKKLVPMSPVGDAAREFSLSISPRSQADRTTELINRLDIRLTHYLQTPSQLESKVAGTTEWNPNGSYVVGTLNGRKVRALTGIVKNPGNGSWTAAPKAKGAWLLAFQYAN